MVEHTLTCCVCGAPLVPEDAEPAPDDAGMFYHQDVRVCLLNRVAALEAELAQTAMREAARLGALARLLATERGVGDEIG
jgi:hypothetical protein